ncbi:MAG: isochorismatase family protein [Clostridiaceae bacterium]|nr:isochorismatase family protein [Clostridiaceae bacterium]
MDKYYLNQNKTGLFLIDIQTKLIPAIYQHEALVKPTNTLITTAELFNLPIYVTEQYPKGLGPTIPEHMSKLEKLEANFWEKTSFTACLPEIIEKFKSDKIDTLIIAGVETHVCVFQTARDLLRLDYNVYLASDAVGSRDPENKKNVLDLMSDMGAVISNSETIAFDLLKDAKASQFKAISNAVK